MKYNIVVQNDNNRCNFLETNNFSSLMKYNIEVTFTLSIFFALRVNMTLLSFKGKRMVYMWRIEIVGFKVFL